MEIHFHRYRYIYTSKNTVSLTDASEIIYYYNISLKVILYSYNKIIANYYSQIIIIIVFKYFKTFTGGF